jgi:hypothetical protein
MFLLEVILTALEHSNESNVLKANPTQIPRGMDYSVFNLPPPYARKRAHRDAENYQLGKVVGRPPASESKMLAELTKKRKIYTNYVISVIENAVKSKGKKLGRKNKSISPLE